MAETSKKNIESQQLEMFGDIGMAKTSAKKDPVSGNDIPKASTAEEVRDDIPAQLSEGEFVLPADVVRYHGLEKLMKLRQEAKQGINTMDKMGQLGNSEEATLPDDLPFDINDLEMAEGGLVTGTYQVPTDIYQQPSYLQSYEQTTSPFKTFVQPVQQQPIQQVQQQQKQTGPSFTTLMPTIGGTRTTKEYRNEAGQKLFIPFIDDKPIYPVPEGYTEYKPAEVTKDTTTTTQKVQPKTTRVTDAGTDSDTMVRSTQVTGLGAGRPINVNFDEQTPDQIKSNFNQMKGGDRGLSVLSALEKSRGSTGLSKTLQQIGTMIVPGGLAMQMYGAGTLNPVEAMKQVGAPDPTTLNNMLSAYGYVEDPTSAEATTQSYNNALSQAMYGMSYADATKQFGVAPSFKAGTKPGDIDIETGNTFDSDGQAGGAYEVPSYSSFADFQKAMSASFTSGFYGSKATAKDVLSRDPTNKKAKDYLDNFDEPTRTGDEDIESKPEYQDDIREDEPVADVVTEPESIVGDDPSGAGDDGVDSSGYGASAGSMGGIGDFNKGGLAKRKPKVKKMKQGGLASKK